MMQLWREAPDRTHHSGICHSAADFRMQLNVHVLTLYLMYTDIWERDFSAIEHKVTVGNQVWI